jgi:hypothetical protein
MELGDSKIMEKTYLERDYKVLYGQSVDEYKQLLYHKKLLDEKTHKPKKIIECPVCQSLNQNSNLFCKNCGVKLKYSFIKYL